MRSIQQLFQYFDIAHFFELSIMIFLKVYDKKTITTISSETSNAF